MLNPKENIQRSRQATYLARAQAGQSPRPAAPADSGAAAGFPASTGYELPADGQTTGGSFGDGAPSFSGAASAANGSIDR